MAAPTKIAPESLEEDYSTEQGQRVLKRDIWRLFALLSADNQGIDARYISDDLAEHIGMVTAAGQITRREYTVQLIAGDVTLLPPFNHTFLLIDTTNQPVRIFLPDATGVDEWKIAAKWIRGCLRASIVPFVGQTIDDNSDGVVFRQQYTSVTLLPDRANWWIKNVFLPPSTDPVLESYLALLAERALQNAKMLAKIAGCELEE